MLNLSDAHLVGHAGKDAELRRVGETEVADVARRLVVKGAERRVLDRAHWRRVPAKGEGQ